MKPEEIQSAQEFTSLLRSGSGSIENPFIPGNVMNHIVISSFFSYVISAPAENATEPLYLELFAGAGHSKFLIEAVLSPDNQSFGYSIIPEKDDYYKADLRDLEESLNRVFLSFLIEEKNFETGESTLLLKGISEVRPTIKLCSDTATMFNLRVAEV